MRIETLCTGDELLTGLTSDTNSRFFQALLLERCGLTVRRSTVVGDVREDLIEALDTLAARCDVVLVSGGLGPTTDDLTIECAAEAAGVTLLEDPVVMAHIRARFEQRGIALTGNNRRQARVPEGSEAVLNIEGSAPLVIQRRGACTLFFVPGVPREYRHLVESFVIPKLEAMTASSRSTVTRLLVLKTMGVPESHLDAKVQPLLAKHPAVTFGYRTHAPENHLKLLARGASVDVVEQVLAAAAHDARALLGEVVFGAGDDTLAKVVGRALLEKRFTLAIAESCTGGLISAACTEVAGASDWFIGGAATYAVSAKTTWAKVPQALVAAHGVVSAPVAEAMAVGVREVLGTTCGLSITGYAGPSGGDAANPVGTVFIGVATPAGAAVEKHRFGGDRERVRLFAAATALDVLRRRLAGS
ncbi:MAG: CinA family nicotinamide mononucleotide deamidase-related protein [Myxococcales bacterium]|nr:CinA family nicotinamide mononucleotide deamidase-related protein [Myxococcales bacterium]